MDTTGLLTELDALNICLSTIGESPVSSLSATGVDVAKANAALKEVARIVQEPGWDFNSDIKYPLAPDVDGYVNIPANTLQIDTTKYTTSKNLVQRGSRLYDVDNQTFVINETIYVDAVWFTPFEELPQAARQYIAIKSARLFHKRVLGSDTIDAYTQEDETDARRRFLETCARTEDLNILTGNWGTLQTLLR